VEEGTLRECRFSFLLLLLLFDFSFELKISAANSEKEERDLRVRCGVGDGWTKKEQREERFVDCMMNDNNLVY
jgi:hypothetical protein